MLHLPRWATDCLKRADPALGASERPLGLWEKQRGAMKLVALDTKASALGLFIGQNVSDARAIVPELDAREIDRTYIERVFADFADWHSNASPLVSILTHAAEWGDLILDISGVSHLFGGEAAMLQKLTTRLEAFGFTVSGAVASTIGSAWGLARYRPGTILAEGIEDRALARFPVAALRLETGQAASLDQFGLKTIGQLYERDRKSLQARFGVSLLLRLDQALGWIEEKIAPRIPLADFSVERRFAEPIGLIEDVLMTMRDLSITLAIQLEKEGLGAQSFHLYLYRVDHRVMAFSVSAASATRNASYISRLFSYRAERLEGEYDAGFGIDMVRLAASDVSPLDASQTGAFGDDGARSLEALYDVISNRLAPISVVRSRPFNSYVPEQAVVLEPIISTSISPKEPPPPVINPRPLRLLPNPEPINVIAEVPDAPPSSMIWRRVSYRFVKASGPERLSAEWSHMQVRVQLDERRTLKGDNLPAIYVEGEQTRDYYIGEDDGGRRFWLFRMGLLGIAAEPRWYLHGFFP